PQAQLAPLARLDVAHIYDEIVRALERMKPCARVIHAVAIPDELRAAELPELACELRSELGRIVRERVRRNGNRARNGLIAARLLLRRFQTLHHQLRKA